MTRGVRAQAHPILEIHTNGVARTPDARWHASSDRVCGTMRATRAMEKVGRINFSALGVCKQNSRVDSVPSTALLPVLIRPPEYIWTF